MFDSTTGQTKKNESCVYCPKELTLPCGSVLKLKSIVNHHGDSPNVGHYTALLLDNRNEKYYHLDDKQVDVLKQIPKEMSKTHYIVIYHGIS